jgi:hypothetical protein
MPDDLAGRVEQLLERADRDLAEQVQYLGEEYAALKRRARWAERADGGRFDARYLHIFDQLGFGRVHGLGERFRMPAAPEPKKKGFWDAGVPGFFKGAGKNVKKTVGDLGDLATMPVDQLVEGLVYAGLHPAKAYHVLKDEVTDKKDREAGNTAQAAGSITVEVAGVFVSILKVTKLTAVKEAAKVAEAGKIRTAESLTTAHADWLDAARRVNNAPRWRKGEVAASPTGAGPGRWAGPHQFRELVVDPAERAVTSARHHAALAETAYAHAHERYERWAKPIERLETYDHAAMAAKVQAVTHDLDASGSEAREGAHR